MVLTRNHGIDKDSWCRQGLMVLTTPMVLTKTHGIESVFLNHTRKRGPSVICMRDFYIYISFLGGKGWIFVVVVLLLTYNVV